MVVKWNRVDRRGQKPGHEASSDEQLPLEVEDKFTSELLAPQWPEAPCLSARTDLARQEPTTYTPHNIPATYRRSRKNRGYPQAPTTS